MNQDHLQQARRRVVLACFDDRVFAVCFNLFLLFPTENNEVEKVTTNGERQLRRSFQTGKINTTCVTCNAIELDYEWEQRENVFQSVKSLFEEA